MVFHHLWPLPSSVFLDFLTMSRMRSNLNRFDVHFRFWKLCTVISVKSSKMSSCNSPPSHCFPPVFSQSPQLFSFVLVLPRTYHKQFVVGTRASEFLFLLFGHSGCRVPTTHQNAMIFLCFSHDVYSYTTAQ